jgi:guanylate kinase
MMVGWVQGLIYFYESIADAKAEVTQADSHSTILQAMQAALQDGKSVIADVDVAAVRALRASNVPGCYVFVLPASMQALQQNIASSLQDPAAGEIERTVAASEKEILSVDEPDLYDYSIQHDDTTATLKEFANLAKEHGLVAAEVFFLFTSRPSL